MRRGVLTVLNVTATFVLIYFNEGNETRRVTSVCSQHVIHLTGFHVLGSNYSFTDAISSVKWCDSLTKSQHTVLDSLWGLRYVKGRPPLHRRKILKHNCSLGSLLIEQIQIHP